MASLTLKDIPEELLEDLREFAERDRRSMTQEAIVLLSEIIAQYREAEEEQTEATRQAKAWEKLAGNWTSTESAEEEVDDIYDSRTRGREVEL